MRQSTGAEDPVESAFVTTVAIPRALTPNSVLASWDAFGMHETVDHPGRWGTMLHVVERARDRPTEVMTVVSLSDTRADAVAALASLLGIQADLADQLLDLKLSEFLGRARTQSH